MKCEQRRFARWQILILTVVVGLWLSLRWSDSSQAAWPVFNGTTRQFWQWHAFAVVRVLRWRTTRAPSPGGGQGFYLAQVRVLAVLATEKTVSTKMRLYIDRTRLFSVAVGPIHPGGMFLVFMQRYNHQWWLPGGLDVPFMPKGKESARVSGLSDPLVKKVAAKVHELISHARSP